MKQGKNIVKQVRSKNVLFRPVPSALALSDRARENDSGNQTVNLPNALTLSRIFVVPLLVVVLLTKFPSEWLGIPQQLFGLALFVGASITDWADGYIARKRGQVSTLGILLDPIADKLLISAKPSSRC